MVVQAAVAAVLAAAAECLFMSEDNKSDDANFCSN
jgi:hypothetical protein